MLTISAARGTPSGRGLTVSVRARRSDRSTSARTAMRRREDQRLKRRGCAEDRRAAGPLVERYLPPASALALRYRHSPEPLDDLSQVVNLGLVKAAQRWDPRSRPGVLDVRGPHDPLAILAAV